MQRSRTFDKLIAFVGFFGIFLIADFCISESKHILYSVHEFCKQTNIANHRGITEVAKEGVSIADGKQKKARRKNCPTRDKLRVGILLTNVMVASGGSFEKGNKPNRP